MARLTSTSPSSPPAHLLDVLLRRHRQQCGLGDARREQPPRPRARHARHAHQRQQLAPAAGSGLQRQPLQQRLERCGCVCVWLRGVRASVCVCVCV